MRLDWREVEPGTLLIATYEIRDYYHDVDDAAHDFTYEDIGKPFLFKGVHDYDDTLKCVDIDVVDRHGRVLSLPNMDVKFLSGFPFEVVT